MTSRIVVIGLVTVIACSGTEAADTTTTLEVTTTAAPTTTSTRASPTTFPNSDVPPLLVASDIGVSLVESGNVILLVDGPVLVAMDDGQGGIIFQRGVAGYDDWDSTIWRMPAGASDAQPLVPPGPGHFLYLNDVAEGPDGAEVWYTSIDRSTSTESVQRLLRHSLATGETTDLGEVGGRNSSVRVSVGGDLVVAEWGAEGFSRCRFHDRDLAPLDSPASPCQEERFEYGCHECPRYLEVSTDGEEVAWLEARSIDGVNPTALAVRSSTSGSELAAFPLPVDRGEVISVDFHQGWVLLNLVGPEGAWAPPLLVDVEGSGGIVELPIIGNGRFARTAIEAARG